MKKIALVLLTGALAVSLAACGGDQGSGAGASSKVEADRPDDDENDGADGADSSEDDKANEADNSEEDETNEPGDGAESIEEADVPNNGEWDEILCSGDGYHLVKKEIDAYDGYKFMLGVVDDAGEWVQELTDTGTFVNEVRFRAEGSSETLRDSSCYMYLGEGVFLASPGVSVFTEDQEYQVGPWGNTVSYSPTGRADVSVWECLLWNVTDNSQMRIKASKMSVFQDGYLLFCEEDEYGSGRLKAMNTKGEITELPCQYLPNKPKHNFPVYSEGLFYACSENSDPGFFDLEGNMVIDLSEYDVRRIPYSEVTGLNSPRFENGQAIILFVNNAGSVFGAAIDKTGNFIGEPEKVASAIPE